MKGKGEGFLLGMATTTTTTTSPKGGANGKPHVLMMTMVMPYLRDSLESKFNLLPLWENSGNNKYDEYLANVADSVRAVVTSTSSCVDKKLLEKLPKVEIVSSFSVGLDKVSE